jgi:hypothetical protein
VSPACSPGVYVGAAGLAVAGVALIAYFASRKRSRTKLFLLGAAGLLGAVLIVTGVELRLREEHDVVKGPSGMKVVCHHQASTPSTWSGRRDSNPDTPA